MRNAGGYRLITEPGKPDIQNDTFTCAHDNRIVRVTVGHLPKYEDGHDIEHCPACKRALCQPCALVYNRTLKCTPFEAWLEMMESKDRFRKALTG